MPQSATLSIHSYCTAITHRDPRIATATKHARVQRSTTFPEERVAVQYHHAARVSEKSLLRDALYSSTTPAVRLASCGRGSHVEYFGHFPPLKKQSC